VALQHPAIRLGAKARIPDIGAAMRVFCLLLAAWLMLGVRAHADEQLVERFDGHDSLTTADFTVPSGWEIRWHSSQVLSLGVIRLDHTVVAGMTGRNIGSLYLPQGGTFRIRVKGEDPIPWDVAVYALDKNATAGDETASDYYAPTPGPDFQPLVSKPETNAPPDTPPAPADVTPPAPPPLPTQLNVEQMRCMVVIKGDRTQGTGFFVKLGGDKLIVTTQQLISNNPNWKVFASNGNAVKVTKIEGATDRDVALLSVKDFGYRALEMADPGSVQPGDAALTGSSDGTLFPSTGVISFGPKRIEIDQLQALPGCPVVLAKSGRVVGMVAAAPQVNAADHFAEENFDERDAAAAGSMATFGLRVDNIASRETYDLVKLQAQTTFLDAFHQHSRTLDAYLNGAGNPTDLHLWRTDDKIKSANESFVQNVAGGDSGGRNDALHALLFELGLAAEADLEQAQLPSNFYGFPGLRAKEETAYRLGLKNQLDAYSNSFGAFNGVVMRNNNDYR
jgi:hypothetical protein